MILTENLDDQNQAKKSLLES